MPTRPRVWSAVLPGVAVVVLIGNALVGAQQPADTPAPAPAPTPAGFGRANPKTIAGYIVLLRLRHDLFLKWKATGRWPDDPEANAALSAHGAYWDQQLKAGRALMAGGMKGDYWDNTAQIVFEAASEAEAQQIVADDPAVKAYVFQAQVRPFDLLYLSNKYQARP